MYSKEYLARVCSCVKIGNNTARYKTLQEVLDKFAEYIEYCGGASIKVSSMQKKRAKASDRSAEQGREEIEQTVPQPMTLTGLVVWMGLPYTWCQFKQVYAKHFGRVSDELRQEFLEYCTFIEEFIKTQQTDGAMVGLYNPSIVARLNGLSDKVEQVVEIPDKEKAVNDLIQKIKEAKGGE